MPRRRTTKTLAEVQAEIAQAERERALAEIERLAQLPLPGLPPTDAEILEQQRLAEWKKRTGKKRSPRP